MASIILHHRKVINGRQGKEKDTMSSREDQAQKGAVANGAAEEAASRTFAHEPGEGEAWWWFGGLATIKATGEQTDGRYSLVEILVPEFPKEEGLLHVHHFEDEGFYILEGEMTFYVGEQTIKARPGSFLFGPKDVPHAFTVDSGPARLLFILSPAGMEGAIREMGESARSLSIPPQPEEPPDEAEMGRLMAIAARYGGEMLGPPPSR
jgi:mannose-6-phosphate isomerase-like protein (cupin superfamily)